MGAAAEPQGRLTVAARLARHADATLAALAALAPTGALADFTGAGLLAERERLGARPAERSCRLLEAKDGFLALNLARDEDWELLPALFEAPVERDWNAVADAVRWRPAAVLVERGRELGLAVALDAPISSFPRTRESRLDPRLRGDDRPPRVIELASLWAGPLCGRLLARLGAEVIKVESAQRPDGARRGSPAFFEALNGAKQQVTLDFATATGRAGLVALLQSADIVIEGSRPRALRQLGIDAERLARERPGLTWLSITGYGRDPRRENWIAYGDDAGVAAGLSHLHWRETGRREVVGDAVADPLTGLAAALAGWTGYRAGGAGVVSLSLCDVVSDALGSYFDY